MIQIRFDINNNPLLPTFVLAKRSGEKLGLLESFEINASESFMNPSEVTFKVYKEMNGVKNPLWDDVKNFRLIWCEEWQQWYQLVLDINESTETTKQVSLTSLCESELSQLSVNDVEINTEDDMERSNYEIAVLYDDTPNCIINRLLKDKAPHYSVRHVDDSIKNIQRMFSFNSTTIYDAFKDIEEEIGCVFVFGEFDPVFLDEARKSPVRTISVYDLQNVCSNGHRTEAFDTCNECGQPIINYGLGDDTAIFVTADELADEITLTTDTDSVKNFMRLETGDEFLTDMVRASNCGSNYIFYFSAETLADMTNGLQNKLQTYQDKYNSYFDNYKFNISKTVAQNYNGMVLKYNSDKKTYAQVDGDSTSGFYILNYDTLLTMLYDATDLLHYLTDSMMPDITMQDTTAQIEASKLSATDAFPVVGVNNYAEISETSAETAVYNMAKYLVDARYQITISTISFSKGSSQSIWKGTFVLTNWSDEDDTYTTSQITVKINGNYVSFIQQRVDIGLKNFDDTDASIVGLFKKSLDSFKIELRKYGLSSLQRFYDCADGVISVLIELGAGNKTSSAYTIYQDYIAKQKAVTSEINKRDTEVDFAEFLIDAITKHQDTVQKSMDLQTYLTNANPAYWDELCSFRRDGDYSNDNYISDGLDNVTLLENARKFLTVAKQELVKSAEQQHTISASLYNLLCIDKFLPLVNKFKVGNWIRVRIDDEVYKLRLIRYDIDFDSLNNLSVEFSDVTKTTNGLSDLRNLYRTASRMATSYDAVTRQVENNEVATKQVDSWIDNGLDLTTMRIMNVADNQTNIMTRNGMLFRAWDYTSQDYTPEQMKMTNSTLAITTDAWESVETAVGHYYYVDPITGEANSTYGIIGRTIVGELILGETLQLRNESNNLLFNNEGLTTGINSDVRIYGNGSVNIGNAFIYDSYTRELDLRVNRLTIGDSSAETTLSIDTLYVGGRNFITNSQTRTATRKNVSSSYFREIRIDVTPYGQNIMRNSTVNDTFILSFDYTINNITTPVTIYPAFRHTAENTISGTGFNRISLAVGDNSGHYMCILKMTSGQLEYGKYFYFSGFGANSNEDAVITFENIKFEKSSLPTSYSPAPEDVDSAINDASKTAINFIDYDSENGLQIGNKINGEWVGARAAVRDASYQVILPSGQLVASFGVETRIFGHSSSNNHYSFREGSFEFLGKFYDTTNVFCLSGGGTSLGLYCKNRDVGIAILSGIEVLSDGQVSIHSTQNTTINGYNTEINGLNNASITIGYDDNKISLLNYASTGNFWIGKKMSTSTDHEGQTFISTGYDTANGKGNDTIRISIPNATNNGHTAYYAIHDGNLSSYVDKLSDISLDSNNSTTNHLYVHRTVDGVKHRAGLALSTQGYLHLSYANNSSGTMSTENYMTISSTTANFQKAISATSLSLTNALSISNGGTGQTGVTTESTLSNIVTQTDTHKTRFEITDARFYRFAKTVQLRLEITTKLSSYNSGDGTDYAFGTIVSGKRPVNTMSFCESQKGVRGYIGTSGSVYVTGTSVSLVAGDTFNVYVTYLLP